LTTDHGAAEAVRGQERLRQAVEARRRRGRKLLRWTPYSERISEMAHSDITLNMMLDQATQIVDTSKWVVVDASSEFWIVDPRIEPTEQNNWGAVFNGIPTRQEAEAIIRNYNTPEEQAWRMEEVRRSRPKPINPPAKI
jgi:hypothetical protein